MTRTPDAVATVTFASPCLSTPRWIEDTRALLAQLSPEAQAAIADAERTDARRVAVAALDGSSVRGDAGTESGESPAGEASS